MRLDEPAPRSPGERARRLAAGRIPPFVGRHEQLQQLERGTRCGAGRASSFSHDTTKRQVTVLILTLPPPKVWSGPFDAFENIWEVKSYQEGEEPGPGEQVENHDQETGIYTLHLKTYLGQ